MAVDLDVLETNVEQLLAVNVSLGDVCLIKPVSKDMRVDRIDRVNIGR